MTRKTLHTTDNSQPVNPVYDTAKSFYNKATTAPAEDGDGVKYIILFSYGTPVLAVNEYGKFYEYGTPYQFSRTTARHIREFLQQHGGGESLDGRTTAGAINHATHDGANLFYL